MALLAIWLIIVDLRSFINMGDMWRLSDIQALVSGILILAGR